MHSCYAKDLFLEIPKLCSLRYLLWVFVVDNVTFLRSILELAQFIQEFWDKFSGE
jgi:hypothetical protein